MRHKVADVGKYNAGQKMMFPVDHEHDFRAAGDRVIIWRPYFCAVLPDAGCSLQPADPRGCGYHPDPRHP